MTVMEIDINKLSAVEYNFLHRVLAEALRTLRKNITVESAKRQENGDVVYRVKRVGAYYLYDVTLCGYYVKCTAVVI